MIFTYGNYTHDNNECWFSASKTVVRGKTGRRMFFRERWIITGVKKAATNAALTEALLALEAAYSRDYGNLLLFDDGVPTRHGLINGQTLSGVKVKKFEYLPGNPGVWGSGTEYVNRRTFRIILEGDVLDAESNIVSYNESIQQIGNGGQKFRMIGSLIGPVQKQIVQRYTPFIAIQQGQATGLLLYPTPPAPLWPTAMHNDRQRGGISSPFQFSPVVNSQYQVTWNYVFESASALTGGPTITL